MVDFFYEHHIIIGNVGFGIAALGFIMRDILWLRIVAAIGTFIVAFYGYLGEAWPTVFWNSLFCAIHGTYGVILVREMMGVKLTKEEQAVYDELFSNFEHVDFYRFIKKAQFKKISKESIITKQGDKINKLYLIYKGEASVFRDGEEIAELLDLSFIGEMAYTTGHVASATVKTRKETQVFIWDFESLNNLLKQHTTVRLAFQNAVGVDLAKKLSNIKLI